MRTIKADVTIGALNSLMVTVPRSCALSTDDPITVTFLDPPWVWSSAAASSPPL